MCSSSLVLNISDVNGDDDDDDFFDNLLATIGKFGTCLQCVGYCVHVADSTAIFYCMIRL
jgi:hypothetical protein